MDGTLYAGGHFYNVGADHDGAEEYQKSYGMAILKSADVGETWTDLRGDPVTVPAVYEERIAVPAFGAYMYLDGLAVDSKGRL